MKKVIFTMTAALIISSVQAKEGFEYNSATIEYRQEATVKSVVDKYIKAAGGLERVSAIKNMQMTMETEIQGMKLIVKSVTDQENNRLLNVTEMNGDQVAKTIIKDGKGKIISMGQEQALTEDQLKTMKSQTYVFPELYYEDLGYTVTYAGLEEEEGVKSHKLLIEDGNGTETYEYYSEETGLKIKTVSELAGTIEYLNYEEREGLMIPTKMVISNSMMPMPMEAFIQTVKFNQELTDEMFE